MTKKPLFDRDSVFWSGVATVAFAVLTILWLKNAEVHGSRLLDVMRVVTERYDIAGLAFLSYIGGTIIPIPMTPVFAFVLTTSKAHIYVTVAITLFASTLGSLTNFYLARLLGHGWVAREAGHKSTKAFLKWFDKYGPVALVLFGILPLPVFDVLTLFAGLSKIGVKKFLVYALIGRGIHLLALTLIVMRVLVIQ